jgi:lysophospholipase L1-like esterase
MVATLNHSIAPARLREGRATVYDSYVALGDSFTEGLDDVRPDGTYRGWADLVATELAARTPGFRYANLAVRGRRLAHIREQQLPKAVAMRPALVTLAGGGNDIIGFRCDVPRLAQSCHEVLESLAETGATVVVFAGFDPRGRLPMGRVLAGRAETYNTSVIASARELGALVVDLWHLPGLYEPAMWAPDRLHLSAAGHVLVAATVLRALGVSDAPEHVAAGTGHDDVRRPWMTARRSDAEWVRTYFAPWVGRQLRGRSAGDLIDPKLPDLTVLPAPTGEPTSR